MTNTAVQISLREIRKALKDLWAAPGGQFVYPAWFVRKGVPANEVVAANWDRYWRLTNDVSWGNEVVALGMEQRQLNKRCEEIDQKARKKDFVFDWWLDPHPRQIINIQGKRWLVVIATPDYYNHFFVLLSPDYVDFDD